jgi:anti-anti-sigma factor
MNDPGLTIRKRADGVLMVSIEGELALESADDFVDACSKLPPGTFRVVFDCAALTFLDSTGANALLQVALRWMESGVEVHLENLAGDLREMLDVLGFFDLLSPQA